MTVIPELRGYKDLYNKQSVYIRITLNGKRSYKKTKIKIEPFQWENGQVINHPNYKLYNQTLRKLIYEAEAGAITSPVKFKSKDFFKYCQDCADEWNQTKASETLRQHKSEINKIKLFDPSVTFPVTLNWLNKYKAHLFSIGNKANTVHKSLKFLRIIIRKAYREKLIETNPFDIFEMPKYRDPQKLYLSKEQINAIDKFVNSGNCVKELFIVGTWFLIGTLTGLRFQDLKNFNKEKHIKNGRLIIYTSKTGEVVSMPISDKLRCYFEQVEYKSFDYTNVHFNRLLKALGMLCGIDQPLNAHQSRHTCAMVWANAGISQEVVAKLLGHRSLRTTNIYYKISGQRIDEELNKLP